MRKRILILLLIISILTSTLSVFAFADEFARQTIEVGSATVDGEISSGEWDKAEKIAVNRAATADCRDKQCVEGASTVSFRAMWDASHLYLLFEIEDDQLVVNENKSTSYRNDSVFVYIGEDDSDFSSYSDATYMLCLFPYFEETDYDSYNENGKSGTIICRNGEHDVTKDQYKCRITGNEESGYSIVMEAAIAFGAVNPVGDMSIAFDIQYNDSNSAKYGSTENNREAIWTWSAVGGDNKGPVTNFSLWGAMKLSDPEGSITPPEDPEPTPDNPEVTTTKATGSENTPTVTDKPSSNVENKDGSSLVLPIVIAILAVVVVGAVIAVVVVKKKKS